MHDFQYKNGELYCEGVPVATVAREVGTPFYLYSHHTLTDHFLKIREAFKEVNPLICFAMKSNDNIAVVKTLINVGAGLDIVSSGELQKALLAQADPRKIVFASVGKTEDEIRAGIEANILLFNVESLPELDTINRIASAMNTHAGIALRINPDVDTPTHAKISTGSLKNKFGIDLATAKKILKNRARYPSLKFKGLHVHIGSQIVSAQPFVAAIKKIIGFIDVLRQEGVSLEYLDIGGGLAAIYKDEKAQTAKQFAGKILPLLKKTGLKIIMEPGRFIAGNAGIFVTKVLYLKDNGVKKFLIVDGGMNDLIRPALYDAYHEIQPVRKSSAGKMTVDVVGPICESGDFLGKDRKLPKMSQGDLLAVMTAGAYGHVMASNYNIRGRAPEVIVKENRFAVTKKRETFEDLVRGESIPEFI